MLYDSEAAPNSTGKGCHIDRVCLSSLQGTDDQRRKKANCQGRVAVRFQTLKCLFPLHRSENFDSVRLGLPIREDSKSFPILSLVLSKGQGFSANGHAIGTTQKRRGASPMEAGFNDTKDVACRPQHNTFPFVQRSCSVQLAFLTGVESQPHDHTYRFFILINYTRI